MQQLVLSISLLVSNRIDTIRNCMESIRPILEQLPSELIAIDTVGEATDGSIDIVREYTDKIYSFTWCNDFSAARNEGLKRAKGEWFMFLDDDEWFEDVTELIRFFKSGEYKNYNSATYRIRDYTNHQGAYTVGKLNRMVKLEEETKFCSPIHEYLAPLKFPCKELTCYIHHYGYAFDSQEEHEKHSERNLSLLRPEFEKNPQDLRLRLQMVQECMYIKRLEEEALSLCKDTLNLGKENWLSPAFQWIITAYVRLADRNKAWEEVLVRIGELQKKFPLSSFASLAFSIMGLKACRCLEQYENVNKFLASLEKSRDFLLSNQQKRHEQSILDFEIFMEASVLAEALSDGIRCLHQMGAAKEAKYWTKMRWKLTKKPALSVSLLVSNNKATIRKCLESLRPLQQSGAEIIIVDTVGEEKSDGSLDIAKRYADKLVHFDWCDDFAAARNAGLELAEGEWFMFLDDDEWFDNVQELVEFFQTGEYLCYNSATYQIRNYKDAVGNTYSMATLARMIRRRPDTRFIGSVHETYNEIMLPCKDFRTFVHHYGYVYATEEERMSHLNRNISLLKKELEKDPLNLRYRAQMAMELASFDNEGAMAFCEETFRLCKDKRKEPEFQWQLSLVFRLYEALGTESGEADSGYEELKNKFGFSETTENSACFQMVRIHLLKNTPDKAYPYAVKYFETLKKLKEKTELQQRQSTADSYRYQTEEACWEMLHFGAYAACNAGAYEQAWEWYQQMPWENGKFRYEQSVWFMIELFNVRPDMKRLADIMRRIAKNKYLMQIVAVRNKVGDVLTRVKEGKSLTDGPDYIKSDIKLSIGILVSNNISTIRKCLDSLTPLREAVKCELIVVDTKGEESDGSIDIAREYADKVYRFKWCNDFAAARNVCMDHAEGEWFLFVDDDEWFDDVTEIIEFFQSGECNHYGMGLYNIHNYFDNSGNFVETIVGRFVHRTPNTRFVGRVHESYNEAYAPNKMFKTFAHHSGYNYQSEEEKKKHQDRNYSLLKAQLKDEGYKPSICSQIAQELFSVQDTWEEGRQFCEECIPILMKQPGAIDNSNTQWILVSTARYYDCINDSEGFWKQTAYLRENFKLTQMAELFMTVMECRIAMTDGDLELCEKSTERFLELWDWLEQHPNSAVEQNQLDFGMYYNEKRYLEVLHNAARCANMQKKFQLANKYWKRFPWDRDGFNKATYWADMQYTMQGLKEMQKRTLSPEMQKLVEQLKQNIRVLIASGNEAAAKELLLGLEELMPGDEDVMLWKRQMK